ncbi:MAG: response regulator [Gemmatimonadetes bacterium]|nr:response regulator [Gemmatimonadota bacterium]
MRKTQGAATVRDRAAILEESANKEGAVHPDGVTPPVILVVEDDLGDRILIERAFEECDNAVQLRFATTGDEAESYLFRFARERGSLRPALVLLDLNVPGVDGRELLREIRADAVLRPTPVVVFTGSDDTRDVYDAYDLGANSYVRKPDSAAGYRKVVRIFEAYWLRRAELPGDGGDV